MNETALPPGTVLGKYSIVRLIGAGGMGAVYEGLHLELRKRVAVKTLLPSLAASPEARARFLREGEAASRIDHPHVVNVTDVGTGGEIPFLVMEFLEGEDLAQKLARDGRMPLDAAVEVLLPIMDALSSGHREGVIHRDLKPHNIFLARGRDGRIVPKLLDFGVSKIMDGEGSSALTGSLHMLGTAQYMAPEQVEGARNVDHRTDQYAMGLVLFECAVGLAARQGETPLGMLRGVALGQLPSLRAQLPDVDPAFEAVVLRTLAVHPAARFASMRELMGALLPFARPHTRIHWAEVLTGSGSGSAPAMAKTMILSDSARLRVSGSAGLRASDSGLAAAGPSTTFRNATGEVALEERLRVRPRARWPLVLGGLGLLLGLLALGATTLLPSSDSSRRSGRAAERAKVDVPPEPELQVAEVPRPPKPRRTLELRATPSDATITVDDTPLGRSPALFELTRGAHQLVVSAPGHQTVTVEFSEETPPPSLIELAPVAAARPVKDRDRSSSRSRAKDRSSTRRTSDPADPASEPAARRGVNNSLIIE